MWTAFWSLLVGIPLALVTLLVAWLVPRVWSFLRPPANMPPGPKTWDFFRGHAMALVREPVNAPQLRWARKYGGIVTYSLPLGGRTMAITSPELLKEVLVTKQKSYEKSATLRNGVMSVVGGMNLLSAMGSEHARMRKAASPGFRHDNLQRFQEAFVDQTQVLVNKLDSLLDEAPGDSIEIELTSYMKDLTLDIIGVTAFAFDFKAQTEQPDPAVKSYMQAFDAVGMTWMGLLGTIFPVLRKLPGGFRSVVNAQKALKGKVQAMIDVEREKGIGNSKSLLGMLIEYSDENTQEEELIGQVCSFMIAGHETTSVSMCWWYYLMSENPDILAKARQEVIDVLGGGDASAVRAPTFDELKQLTYLEATIRETLRLFTPIPLGRREAGTDMTLGGYHIPAGTELSLAIGAMHRLDSVYEEAERFMPERWLDDDGKKYSHFAWLPFYAGNHSCIGNRFAVLEMKTVLAVLMSHFDMTLKEGATITPSLRLTIQPKPAMPMIVKRVASR